jgi:hypothetical protein
MQQGARIHEKVIVSRKLLLPGVIRRAARASITAAQLLDPSRLALTSRRHGSGSVALVAVYRARHAKRMRRLVQQLDADVTVRLWCLDEPPPQLRNVTHGHGPGVRFQLLNSLIDTIPRAQRRDCLILSDDDYFFLVGSLPQLVVAGEIFGLDLWQPAHARSSSISYPFVRRRVATVVRRTTFVEQGPVVALSARAQDALLPLPEDLGMGWGAEVRWADVARDRRLRLGIVDALAIHHFASESYDKSAQLHQLHAVLDEAGIASLDDIQQECSRSRAWDGLCLMRDRASVSCTLVCGR